MARLFTCGFELGELIGFNGSVNQKYGEMSIVTSPVRSGTYAMRNNAGYVSSLSAYAFFTEELSDLPELYARIAFRHAGLNTSSDHKLALLGFYDGGTNQVTLAVDPVDGRLLLLQGGGGEMGYDGTQLAKGTAALTQDVWYVIEVYVKAASSGQVTVKINNITDISYSGNTAPSGNDQVNQVQIGLSTYGEATQSYCYFDDIAINDTSGSYQNSWPGQGGVLLLVPNADGDETDWAPSEGSVHYSLVDDIPANTTDWVQAKESGSVDLFQIEDLPPDISLIQFVQPLWRAALSEPGFNQLKDLIRVGTVTYEGITQNVTSAVQNYVLGQGSISYTIPGGTDTWGTADVNAVQAGIKIP